MKHEIPGLLFLKIFSMTLASWILTNYDKIAATFTSLVAGGYMLWKWYRDYKKAKYERDQIHSDPLHGHNSERLN